jgi:ABC-type multidrug transport system fused ATPase/permease subunit
MPTRRLKQLLSPHRSRIAGVLGLELLQQCAWIAEPFVFGRAIDALIEHNNEQINSLLVQLTPWIAIFATNSAAGVLRRVLAVRVYTSLYSDVCMALMQMGARQSTSVAQTASRAEIFRDLVVFLDERAPTAVAAVVNVGGSAIALALFDCRIALVCSLVVIPAVVALRIVNTRVIALQRAERDLRERNSEAFVTGDTAAVAHHFARISRVRMSAAGWGATNFGVLRLFMLTIFISVLFISIDLDGYTTGAIYSIVAYLWTFVTYSEDVPLLLEARASLRDLSRRLEQPPVESTAAVDHPARR